MRKEDRLDFGRGVYIIISVLLIILVFAGIDYFVHSLNEADWGVPGYYFTNKIIYGIIWGLVAYFLIRRWKAVKKIRSLIFSVVVAAILQIRYAYEGYSMSFVLLFLVLHFLILWPVSYLIFRFMKERI